MREPRQLGDDPMPAEQVAMKVPPRNRWQVLLVEYELLDAYWAALHARTWVSGMVVVGLSMIGITFQATMMQSGIEETSRMLALIGGICSLITFGWWLLIRRMFAAQRVAEYRRNEIERELGMRSSLYLTFLRQSRKFENRGTTVARQLAEGDNELEQGLRDFGLSSEGKPWMPRLMSERLVWSVMPWLLIAAWGSLFLMKA
ncbi:MAG: hypothetical protein DK304_000543 [Chloroflexi bacterium]|jgi:hypothetical protein|nr:MAG: hypothetical protein DK304_000543 [Chloroflexota bacterium]